MFTQQHTVENDKKQTRDVNRIDQDNLKMKLIKKNDEVAELKNHVKAKESMLEKALKDLSGYEAELDKLKEASRIKEAQFDKELLKKETEVNRLTSLKDNDHRCFQSKLSKCRSSEKDSQNGSVFNRPGKILNTQGNLKHDLLESIDEPPPSSLRKSVVNTHSILEEEPSLVELCRRIDTIRRLPTQVTLLLELSFFSSTQLFIVR